MKPRIVHVYKDVFPPIVGGIERHIDSIRQALPDLQHDVVVCGRQLWTRVKRAADNGGIGDEVYVGELGRFLSTPLAPTFPLWLSRYARGAIVHTHMPQPVGELSTLLARGVSPVVATYHADIFRQRSLLFAYRPLILRMLRAADAVIVASERLRDGSPLVRAARVEPHVIPYGIDTDRWRHVQAAPERVATLRRRFGEKFVLGVGRLVPYKGFNYLIEAAKLLDAPVVIVGDGMSRAALEAQAAALGVEDRVHLVGRVDDAWLRDYFAAATVFALPSWNRAEAFGLVLLEAQAAGLPVVATEIGTGTTEAFEPGETGFSVPPCDPEALADALNQLLRDDELAQMMGAAGEHRVLERNSYETLAQAMRPIYERLWERVSQEEPERDYVPSPVGFVDR